MSLYDSIQLLFRLAFMNLFSRKVKSLIIGTIMAFGSALFVMGDALLDSLGTAMERSITKSLAGHIQIYSEDAKDPLDLFPAFSLFDYDFGVLPNFAKVKEALIAHSNIDAIVPMGPDRAILTVGNDLDRMLADLRETVQNGPADRVANLAQQVRHMVTLLEEDYENVAALTDDKEAVKTARGNIQHAKSEEFWQEFDADPLNALEFLENKIAPLSFDAKNTFMLYLGTDIEKFSEQFDLLHILKGEMVPPGRRGFLFSHKFYEEQMKHRVAVVIDKLHEWLIVDGKKLSEDVTMRDMVKLNKRQYKRIVFQLDPEEAKHVEGVLREHLNDQTSTLSELTEAFLDFNDENFPQRYKLFYEHIAPRIHLYFVKIGEPLTIKTLTRSGYINAVNVKVYGTFQFSGMEGSDMAGIYNLMDLVTFRDLYGFLSEEQKQEIAALKNQFEEETVKMSDFSEDGSLEDALFGGSDTVEVAASKETSFDEFEGAVFDREENQYEQLMAEVYPREEVEEGIFVNAAIILKDSTKLKETIADIENLSKQQALNIKAVSWQDASGILGQYTIMIRAVLYFAVGVIFLVAIVIINNSMVMATLERIREIGTLRAIGAQRSFIMLMFLLETFLLAALTGAVGAFGGAGVITFLGYAGIPAPNDFFKFFFGGPELYPTVSFMNLLIGFVVICIVSVLSTLYPAIVATRVQPVVAMQD